MSERTVRVRCTTIIPSGRQGEAYIEITIPDNKYYISAVGAYVPKERTRNETVEARFVRMAGDRYVVDLPGEAVTYGPRIVVPRQLLVQS